MINFFGYLQFLKEVQAVSARDQKSVNLCIFKLPKYRQSCLFFQKIHFGDIFVDVFSENYFKGGDLLTANFGTMEHLYPIRHFYLFPIE